MEAIEGPDCSYIDHIRAKTGARCAVSQDSATGDITILATFGNDDDEGDRIAHAECSLETEIERYLNCLHAEICQNAALLRATTARITCSTWTSPAHDSAESRVRAQGIAAGCTSFDGSRRPAFGTPFTIAGWQRMAAIQTYGKVPGKPYLDPVFGSS